MNPIQNTPLTCSAFSNCALESIENCIVQETLQKAITLATEYARKRYGDKFSHLSFDPTGTYDRTSIRNVPIHPYLQWHNTNVHFNNGEKLNITLMNVFPQGATKISCETAEQLAEDICDAIDRNLHHDIELIAKHSEKSLSHLFELAALSLENKAVRKFGDLFGRLSITQVPVLSTTYPQGLVSIILTDGSRTEMGSVPSATFKLTSTSLIATQRDFLDVVYDISHIIDNFHFNAQQHIAEQAAASIPAVAEETPVEKEPLATVDSK